MFKRIILVLLILIPAPLTAQHVALKSNALYWATCTPNITVEAALFPKITMEIAGSYNPWDFSRDLSLRHWSVRPAVRYWFCKAFQGHSIGIDGIYGKFDVGNIPFIAAMKDFSYKGTAYGASVSYAYHFPIGKRWGMELTAGVGYLKASYEKYICSGCSETQGNYVRDYIGPTKLGISFIFLLN